MRVYKHAVRALFISGLSGLLLAGCSTRVGDKITIPMGELAMYDAIPKAKSISQLENHIKDAKSDNMPFLAPHYFREASDILERAQQSSSKVSTGELAKADAILDKGEAISATVKMTFSKELELKALLDKHAANEIYPWKYKIIVYELSKLIEAVELDRGGNIEGDKEELNKSMQVLYTQTVQYTSSHESHIINQGTPNKDDEK